MILYLFKFFKVDAIIFVFICFFDCPSHDRIQLYKNKNIRSQSYQWNIALLRDIVSTVEPLRIEDTLGPAILSTIL